MSSRRPKLGRAIDAGGAEIVLRIAADGIHAELTAARNQSNTPVKYPGNHFYVSMELSGAILAAAFPSYIMVYY